MGSNDRVSEPRESLAKLKNRSFRRRGGPWQLELDRGRRRDRSRTSDDDTSSRSPPTAAPRKREWSSSAQVEIPGLQLEAFWGRESRDDWPLQCVQFRSEHSQGCPGATPARPAGFPRSSKRQGLCKLFRVGLSHSCPRILSARPPSSKEQVRQNAPAKVPAPRQFRGARHPGPFPPRRAKVTEVSSPSSRAGWGPEQLETRQPPTSPDVSGCSSHQPTPGLLAKPR